MKKNIKFFRKIWILETISSFDEDISAPHDKWNIEAKTCPGAIQKFIFYIKKQFSVPKALSYEVTPGGNFIFIKIKDANYILLKLYIREVYERFG